MKHHQKHSALIGGGNSLKVNQLDKSLSNHTLRLHRPLWGLAVVFIFSIFMLASCTKEENTSQDSKSSTGTVTINVVATPWHEVEVNGTIITEKDTDSID